MAPCGPRYPPIEAGLASRQGRNMTGIEELEMLAKDCEELALDAQEARDEGLKRAHLSIAYRIRHALKKLTGKGS